jgi:hypothetical protein
MKKRVQMRRSLLVLTLLALGACTADVDTTYESGGTVVDTVVNHQDSIGLDIARDTTSDTMSVPVTGTEKDTGIVNKPVLKGRKPVEMKRPTDLYKTP